MTGWDLYLCLHCACRCFHRLQVIPVELYYWVRTSEYAKEESAIHRNFSSLLHASCGTSSYPTIATLTKKKKSKSKMSDSGKTSQIDWRGFLTLLLAGTWQVFLCLVSFANCHHRQSRLDLGKIPLLPINIVDCWEGKAKPGTPSFHSSSSQAQPPSFPTPPPSPILLVCSQGSFSAVFPWHSAVQCFAPC